MAYSVEKIADAPILVLVQEGRPELEETLTNLAAVLDTQSEPVFLVFDMSAATVGLDDITAGANATTQGPGAVLRHPNVRETLVVTSVGFMKLAARGLSSPIFGSVKIRVFDTRDQAVEYCREQISQVGTDRSQQSRAG